MYLAILSIGLEPISIDYKTTALPIKPTQQLKEEKILLIRIYSF